MKRSYLVLAAVLLQGGAAWAQDGAQGVPEKAVREVERLLAEREKAARAPVWTDPEFEAIAGMLHGSWISDSAVSTVGEGDAKSQVIASFAPVRVEGVPNAMYCEVVRADAPRVPYRQTVLSFARVGGKVRMTTHEFRRSGGLLPSAYWTWAAPETFPRVTPDDLVATMMVDLTGSAGRYEGRSPHAYPSSMHGAVEMTTSLTITPTSLETADRGIGADGSQVWGPAPGSSTSWQKHDLGLKVRTRDGGLVSITYPTELTGEPAKQGELLTVHYAGYLQDGRTFDTSYQRGQPFKYAKGQPLIEGWNTLMEDMQAGMVRRIIVPGNFAYGERGRPPTIPPNATLVFDIEVLAVEPAPPPPAPPAPPADPQGEGKPKFEVKPVEIKPSEPK
ncbi:MAG: CpcT/CpeT family chromophore lyase [Planctomycetota bacterium]|nr:CpcT/CpeT family chromophore lyase [Planctomycetota bacterium]